MFYIVIPRPVRAIWCNPQKRAIPLPHPIRVNPNGLSVLETSVYTLPQYGFGTVVPLFILCEWTFFVISLSILHFLLLLYYMFHLKSINSKYRNWGAQGRVWRGTPNSAFLDTFFLFCFVFDLTDLYGKKMLSCLSPLLSDIVKVFSLILNCPRL